MKWIAWGFVGAALGFGVAFLAQRAFEPSVERTLDRPSAVGRAVSAPPPPSPEAGPVDGGLGLQRDPEVAVDARTTPRTVPAQDPTRDAGDVAERPPSVARSSAPVRTSREPETRAGQTRRPPSVVFGSSGGGFVPRGNRVADAEARTPELPEPPEPPEPGSTFSREEPEPGSDSSTPDDSVDEESAGSTFTRECAGAGFECRANTDCCAGLFCEGGIAGYGTIGRCR